uniref:Malectin-like domain-containing protein n=1 Tax=Brassica oleracea var. oleracea TaxID=109376 RepID=A0A0D2ZXX6_BRAOL
NETTIVTKEIIHTLGSDHVQVCLVDKGRGTPFMSVLELRLLKNDMYETPHDKLMLIARRDVGSISNISVRYKDDAYDRLWTPRQFENFTTLNTSLSIDQTSSNCLQPPLIVMRTANAPRRAIQYINMLLEPKDPKGKFYIYMHFAEIVKLQRNETRVHCIGQ